MAQLAKEVQRAGKPQPALTATRVVRTRHKAAMTPHVARAKKVQTVREWWTNSKKGGGGGNSEGGRVAAVVDEVNCVEGVPFADSFVVFQRLVVTTAGSAAGSAAAVRVRGVVWVGFRRSLMLGRQVTRGAQAECAELQTKLLSYAARSIFRLGPPGGSGSGGGGGGGGGGADANGEENENEQQQKPRRHWLLVLGRVVLACVAIPAAAAAAKWPAAASVKWPSAPLLPWGSSGSGASAAAAT